MDIHYILGYRYKSIYWEKMITGKRMWQSLSYVKPVVPHLRKEDNESTNDQETADVPGKFFESVITTEDDGDNILPEFENSSRKQGFKRDHIY